MLSATCLWEPCLCTWTVLSLIPLHVFLWTGGRSNFNIFFLFTNFYHSQLNISPRKVWQKPLGSKKSIFSFPCKSSFWDQLWNKMILKEEILRSQHEVENKATTVQKEPFNSVARRVQNASSRWADTGHEIVETSGPKHFSLWAPTQELQTRLQVCFKTLSRASTRVLSTVPGKFLEVLSPPATFSSCLLRVAQLKNGKSSLKTGRLQFNPNQIKVPFWFLMKIQNLSEQGHESTSLSCGRQPQYSGVTGGMS